MSTDALPGRDTSRNARCAPPGDAVMRAAQILHQAPADLPYVILGGSAVHLVEEDTALRLIGERAVQSGATLAVVSANLDHLHHFGVGGRWHGVLEHAEAPGALEFLTLLDGMPLVHHAEALTGRPWPRLAGSDLIGPILDEAGRVGASVGFLGGPEDALQQLRDGLAVRRPTLKVAGTWSPPRAVVADPAASGRLAEHIRRADVDILVVGMGKPRQELWVAQHGLATGAKVLLAFGAVVDFLAGRVSRAPGWMARSGLEWSYRLALEPRRLSRRYLLDGPEAYLRLRHESRAAKNWRPPHVRDDNIVDITMIVTSDRAPSETVLDGLRHSSGDLTTRIVVAEGDPWDAFDSVGPTRAVLLVAPGQRPAPGAVSLLWKRLWQDGVGAVVPRTTAPDGATEHTLRFSRTASRVWGERLLGMRLPGRPSWSTLTDRDVEAYQHAHPVQDALPGCILLRADIAERYAASPSRRRPSGPALGARETGWSVWYEPTAVVCRADLAAIDSLESRDDPSEFPKGSIVIPAHNEGAVLDRTLSGLAPVIATGRVDVIVACNGCTDETADIARRHSGTDVIELPNASKALALNAADSAAGLWPRLYLDADIEISPATIRAMFAAVNNLQPRAARAPYAYDVDGASPLVRAYHRARTRLPAPPSDLWGAGAFVLNEAARGLFGAFPHLVADDLFVSAVIDDNAKVAVDAEPVVVRAPRTVRGLFAVVRRSCRGSRELARATGLNDPTAGGTLRALIRTTRSPVGLWDTLVYVAFASSARLSLRRRTERTWERDDSSRLRGSRA